MPTAPASRKLVHPDAVSGRTGLLVMRGNPMHRGHAGLIGRMNEDCDTSILAFGSTQLAGVPGHPFSFDQRVEMARALFGPLLRFIALADIDSLDDNDDWVDYVLEKVHKAGLPPPTDYYSGSKTDAKWYVNRFARFTDPAESDGLVTTYGSAETARRLHVLDRTLTPTVSGSEIRSLIERRDEEWKRYVPAKLWRYIERNYPPHLRTALKVDQFPADAPVGTAAILKEDGIRYLLRDDGKWRPERTTRSAARGATGSKEDGHA